MMANKDLNLDKIADVAAEAAKAEREKAAEAALQDDDLAKARLHNDTANELDRIEENLRRSADE